MLLVPNVRGHGRLLKTAGNGVTKANAKRKFFIYEENLICVELLVTLGRAVRPRY